MILRNLAWGMIACWGVACGQGELSGGPVSDSGASDAGGREDATGGDGDVVDMRVPDMDVPDMGRLDGGGGTCVGAPSAETIAAARLWVNATESERTAMEPGLRSVTSCIGEIIAQVRPHDYADAPTGLVTFQSFDDPEVDAIFPGHQWHMYVPDNYDPAVPIGVVYSMHYGGSYDASENEIQHILDFDMSPETGDSRSLMRPHTNGSNYILISPIGPFYPAIPISIPWASRWNVPLADRYFIEIIKQVNETYNIDFDRIAAVGFSMGAPGAVHLAQVLNDRLSASAPFNPSMRIDSWTKLNDLPIYLVHGINDTITDVRFSDVINDCLDDSTSDHVYVRHDGGHEFETPEPEITEFLDGMTGWLTTKTRNPYRSRVHARDKWRSHAGTYDDTDVTWDEDPSPHTYWISINESRPGNITYDRAINDGTNITRGTMDLPGASVDASISGNTITVSTLNVASFSLWLTPAMVGNATSVTIVVDGVSQTAAIEPNLLDALRSYERRWDWNMSYWQEIRVDVP